MNLSCCDLLDARLLRLSLRNLPTYYLRQPTAAAAGSKPAETKNRRSAGSVGVGYERKRIEQESDIEKQQTNKQQKNRINALGATVL